MIYNIDSHRKIIGDYLFETDENFNIYVYKNDNLEFIEEVQIGYKYDFEEFVELCNEWIEGKKGNVNYE